MSTVKVNAIRSTSGSSDAITLNSSSGVTAINGNGLRAQNLIINGAMQVAQRGTSATAEEYATVDRFELSHGGEDEACTQAQHALTSSDTGPWAKGLRYSYHITNGNQSSGADAGDFCMIRYRIEAQDIAACGWDCTSASSYLTLSFWVKASVAQNYYGYVRSDDGTSQSYPFQTGSLSANTWTKITKTIPGNSNITINNDNGYGLEIHFLPFLGTNYTASGVTLDAWAPYDSATRMADNTVTWWETDDATFEITGVQLEVGSTASEFMFESYGETLAKCQRYFTMIASGADSSTATVSLAFHYSATSGRAVIHFPTTMRSIPDIYEVSGTDYWKLLQKGGTTDLPDAIHGGNERLNQAELALEDDVGSLVTGEVSLFRINHANARLGYDAEL